MAVDNNHTMMAKAAKLHPSITLRRIGSPVEVALAEDNFFVAAAAAGISGIAADMMISLPSPRQGSKKTGISAPIAEPAIEKK